MLRLLRREGHTKRSVLRELPFDAAESQTLSMRGHSLRGNRETRKAPPPDGVGGRSAKAMPKRDSYADREFAWMTVMPG